MAYLTAIRAQQIGVPKKRSLSQRPCAPPCLIIDEIGHCAFDKENTRLFFDLIGRRYNKEGNLSMVFTSNKSLALWHEDFEEDATLLCKLDRIFDDISVFKAAWQELPWQEARNSFFANRKDTYD